MKRRSFLSLAGAGALSRLPFWRLHSGGQSTRQWGPPTLGEARAEHGRVVLSFTPVEGAVWYVVRYRTADGAPVTIESVLVTDYTVHGLENGTRYWFSVAAAGARGTTAFSNERAAIPTMEMDWLSLATAFTGQNPTRSSCPFWMVHGKETDEELRRFLEVAYRFGFEGVTLHPYDFDDFLSEGEWHRWKVIVDQARKLGLVVWQQDDKNYPSGYAAGTVVAKDRRLARWEVIMPYSERRTGPASLTLDFASILGPHQQLLSVSAFGPKNVVEDLTGRVSGGRLRWDIPNGEWHIFVAAAWQPGVDDPKSGPDLVRGEVRGYIDPLSEEATDRYVDAIQGATFRQLGSEFGRVWKGFFIDEPGFHGTGAKLGITGAGYPYTPDLLKRFERRYGYSLRPLLPMLWVSRGPQTSSVRYDYMDFVSSEYARLFIGKLTKFAEVHGIQVTGHIIESPDAQLGAGTGSNFRTLEHFSMGGFDHIFDQWYTPDDDVYWRQPKLASSISHYKETPLDEATVEHFAATGWQTGLTEMKAPMDWTTCRGLNRIVPCGLDTQDPPVWEDAPEFWLHGRNPLAPYFHAYQIIANRETMMIRGGRHVAKALVLDTAESAWAGRVEELWKVCKALSQAHFDYDLVSQGAFMNRSRCRFDGKRVLLGHEDYEFVFLPGMDAISLPLLQRLLEFYEGGGTVILLGSQLRLDSKTMQLVHRLPYRSADGRHDAEVTDLVARLWGSGAGGKGRAYLLTFKDATSFLYSLNAHDVWVDPNLRDLQYYHRKLSGRDLYFFNNEGEAAHTEVRLRGAHGVPEFWDPASGQIRQAPCHLLENDGVQVRLDLKRYQSVFVVVNPTAKAQRHLTATDADEVQREPDGRILVKKYAPGFVSYSELQPDGTSQERRLATPRSRLAPVTLPDGWSRTPRGGNAAVYRTSFKWLASEATGAELRIRDMSQVIRLRLNGQDFGIRFTYPFRFDIGSALRPGMNELELEHVERHTFQSRLGKVQIIPYYGLRV